LKVCIAEKPSVAKEIASILGANSRKDGYFEGNGYQVTWTFGHLCTLKEPDDYSDNLKKWLIDSLPILPQNFEIKLIKNDGVKKQFNVIKSLFDKCELVINCGDAGLEGEVIQRWVLKNANCTKPVKRLWISSLTEEAIKEGFSSLQPSEKYDNLYAAGNSRAVGDWLLGINATRLYTLKYSNNKGVLSIGRVQTPTLALIVNRQKEIDNFIPKTYWELKTKYRDVIFSSSEGKIEVVENANELLKSIVEDDFEITSFTKKKGKESPPKLFDLTSLQVEANKKYSLSAEDTLNFTQKLYEKKVVTYPRVDTMYLPDDMYPKIYDILKKLKFYEEYVNPLLKEKIRKSKNVFDNKKVTDHHAIIPTGIQPSNLTIQEKYIYDLVTRRFIANFYPDCIVSNTNVTGIVKEIEFKTSGKQILEDGWRVLYPSKNESKSEGDDKNETQILPEFKQGEKGPHEPFVQEKTTQPPKPHTEATLLRAMETAGKQIDDEELRELMKENGIGRPSTRANIIETLFKRNYIVKTRKSLIPTEIGINLIDTIKNDLLKSAELTGLWERKLKQIEKGTYKSETFINEMKVMVSDLVKEVCNERKSYNNPSVLKCPKCKNGEIIKGKNAYGCNNYRNGCDFKIDFEYNNRKIDIKELCNLINNRRTGVLSDFVLNNEPTQGVLFLDDNFKVNFFEHILCPKCKNGSIIKGNFAYGCSNYKNGCDFKITFESLEKEYNTKTINNKIIEKIKF